MRARASVDAEAEAEEEEEDGEGDRKIAKTGGAKECQNMKIYSNQAKQSKPGKPGNAEVQQNSQ